MLGVQVICSHTKAVTPGKLFIVLMCNMVWNSYICCNRCGQHLSGEAIISTHVHAAIICPPPKTKQNLIINFYLEYRAHTLHTTLNFIIPLWPCPQFFNVTTLNGWRLSHLSWTNLGIKITQSYFKKLGTTNLSSTQQKVIWQENALLQHYYGNALPCMQLADLHCSDN